MSHNLKFDVSIKTVSLFSVPLEFPILKRERFNRWYSSSAYFTALNVGDFPVTFFCSFFYVSITYFMTNQPRELQRFLNFASVSLALSYASQGIGLVGSAFLDVKVIWLFGYKNLFTFDFRAL